jgi:hypothetical protein
MAKQNTPKEEAPKPKEEKLVGGRPNDRGKKDKK